MYQDFANQMPKPFHPIAGDFVDIGGVLRAFMEEKKIDGATLSRLSGVSESEVYNILKNRRVHSGLKTLSKLTAPLGKTLADLFLKLACEKEGNVQTLEKDPAFFVEYKKEGFTIFSDMPAAPELFIGRMSFAAGAKGISSEGLRENCLMFFRVAKGMLEVELAGKSFAVGVHQKIFFNGNFPHAVRNKSAREPAEALMVTAPSFWTAASARGNPL